MAEKSGGAEASERTNWDGKVRPSADTEVYASVTSAQPPRAASPSVSAAAGTVSPENAAARSSRFFRQRPQGSVSGEKTSIN
jgi:hypothetical protein